MLEQGHGPQPPRGATRDRRPPPASTASAAVNVPQSSVQPADPLAATLARAVLPVSAGTPARGDALGATLARAVSQRARDASITPGETGATLQRDPSPEEPEDPQRRELFRALCAAEPSWSLGPHFFNQAELLREMVRRFDVSNRALEIVVDEVVSGSSIDDALEHAHDYDGGWNQCYDVLREVMEEMEKLRYVDRDMTLTAVLNYANQLLGE